MLCWSENDIEPSHHRERKDDVSVFVLLVAATKQVGGAPDETRNRRMVHFFFLCPNLNLSGKTDVFRAKN